MSPMVVPIPNPANTLLGVSGRAFLAFVLCAALGLATGCGKKHESQIGGKSVTRVRFLTDWYPQAEHGGFYQALAKGYYAKAGLDVEIVPGGAGATIGQKLLADQAEMAMGISDGVIANVGDGVPFIIVGAYLQHDPQAVLVHDDDPVKTLLDLKGRPVMTTPGSNWVRYLKGKFGVDFPVIPINYGIAQFMSDKRFIQQCFITNEPFFLREQGVKARALLISESGYDPYRVIFTTRRFLREHPDAARAFVSASLQGWSELMNGDPSPAKQLILARNDKMTSELFDFSLQAMRDFQLVAGNPKKNEAIGQLTRERIQGQVDLLMGLGIIAKPIAPDKFVSFDSSPITTP